MGYVPKLNWAGIGGNEGGVLSSQFSVLSSQFSVLRVSGVRGSKGWILPISRMGVNEWRVRPEANREERRGHG
jgi:hypothetical protein